MGYMFGYQVKEVGWRQLKKGDIIKGYYDKYSNTTNYFLAEVLDTNLSYITVVSMYYDHTERVISSDCKFIVELTEEEILTKYRESAKEIVKLIKNELPFYEIGDHEMWNGWVCADPYEQAFELKRNNLVLLGVCKDIPYGDKGEIGIVARDEDGDDNFWCHIPEKWFDDWEEEYPELYK